MNVLKYAFVQNFSDDEKLSLAPKRQSELASGFDLASAHKENIIIEPMARKVIATGIKVEIMPHFEGQVRSRSGLSSKHAIVVLNSPGTIDADYRGEIKVILANLSSESFTITFGMRIAQLVICPVSLINSVVVDELSETSRSSNGFGSTGLLS